MTLAQRQYSAGSFSGFYAYAEHGAGEEFKPALPIAFIAHGLKSSIVLLAVLFEVVGKIKHGALQDFLLA